MKKETCEFCKFWEKADERGVVIEGDFGRCKRYAPLPMPKSPEVSNDFNWPLTRKIDWCGEFKNGKEKKEIKLPKAI